MEDKLKEIIKIDLIREFRDLVNDNNSFIYVKYSNIRNKNLFNPICSSMDWIGVTTNYLYNFPSLSKDIDVKVMQIYSFISSIDITLEAIKQLHRILLDDYKLKKWPFFKENNIFKNKTIKNINDDDYFKEIRAHFGAHPTNLNGNDNEKLFASWPFHPIFDDNDLSVRVYPNAIDKDDLKFGIKLNELIEYFDSRYCYLKDLMTEINKQYKNFCDEYKKIPIQNSQDIVSELEILKNEAEIRLNNNHYIYTLNDLTKIFRTSLGEHGLKKKETIFKEALEPLITEIRKNLQEMNLIDLKESKYISYSLKDKSHTYELTKLYTWLYSNSKDPLADYYLNKMNEISNGEYSFSILDSKEVNFLKLKIMLFFDNN
ncbi:hypothetical protein [Proteus mirabilis]|uniref:hypothetical protein n=1 Tax=Proteus mirabilis TaxID=584 RepID=UPI000789CF78|nr:hypothetical protein [Proteus mirabilis]MBN7188369.1 hypothetical protein [Proteus mirabilis]MBN7242508.1 hypothetical protein [Proteus mirabilis]HCU2506403.1 hypothetical protein [Proteus mirabilis]HEJ9733042.1 hypothetical protein [Proteus mirabilis]HEK0651339.1 hypothetical protein [Proteus mirabilis]